MVKDTRVTESGFFHWMYRALGSHRIVPVMHPVALWPRADLSYIPTASRPARRDLINEARNPGTGGWRRETSYHRLGSHTHLSQSGMTISSVFWQPPLGDANQQCID